jgi:hypothetical protein
MRADEVLGLNCSDMILDPSREKPCVCDAKNNCDRIVVLDSGRMENSLCLLRSWLRDLGSRASPTTYMSRFNRGAPVSYDALHHL